VDVLGFADILMRTSTKCPEVLDKGTVEMDAAMTVILNKLLKWPLQ